MIFFVKLKGVTSLKKVIYIYVILIAIFLIIYKIYFQNIDILSIFKDNNQNKQTNVSEEYVFVTFSVGIDYWKGVLKGAEDASEILNVAIEYRGSSQYDVNEQIAILEQEIAKRPAGIAISAIDPELLNPTIDKAIKLGIPVVLFDSNAPNSSAYKYIGTDNYQAGVTAAHKMASILGNKGNVAVVSSPKQENHSERVRGFYETIQQYYSDIKIVELVDCEGDQQKAKEEVIDMLSSSDEIDGIFSTEANSTVGVGEAVQLMDKKNEVEIIGFDTEKETLDMIKDGTISASIAQDTWKMGFWSLQYLYQLNHHSNNDDNKTVISTDTGTVLVTDGNVDQYYENN